MNARALRFACKAWDTHVAAPINACACFAAWLAGLLAGLLACCLIGWLAARLIGWLAGWLAGWLDCWLIGFWLAGLLVG